jgi:hypothetical protein
VKIPREACIFQMAKLMYEESELFGSKTHGPSESPGDDVRRSAGGAVPSTK